MQTEYDSLLKREAVPQDVEKNVVSLKGLLKAVQDALSRAEAIFGTRNMIVDKKLVSWDEFKNIISQGQNEDYSWRFYDNSENLKLIASKINSKFTVNDNAVWKFLQETYHA